MNNIAVYPGSFDPCTNGHLDIIERSAKLFEKLYVAALINSQKAAAFSVEERMEMLKKVTRNIPNVEVAVFDGLLVNLMDELGANVIVKGLRAMSDFEFEFQQALINSKLNKRIETVFMTTASENSFLSSSMVREVAHYGGRISDFVPHEIEEDIMRKFGGEMGGQRV